MPNFPSIYLELQELWKRLRGIADNIKTIQDDIVDGVPPSGPAGGVLHGQYPNPDGIGANDGLETVNLYCFNGSATQLNLSCEKNLKIISDENVVLESNTGDVRLVASDAIVSLDSAGEIRVLAGNASHPATHGGNITASAGFGTNGGNILLEGGSSSGITAGDVVIKAGKSTSTADNGIVKLYGGFLNSGIKEAMASQVTLNSSSLNYGGELILSGGYGIERGGSITISAGSGNVGGDITIHSGRTDNIGIAGIDGDIFIDSGLGTIHLDGKIDGGIIFTGSNQTNFNRYEEGVWTPSTGSGITGVSATSGSYTIIGNMCFLQGVLETTTAITSSGNATAMILNFSSQIAPPSHSTVVVFVEQSTSNLQSIPNGYLRSNVFSGHKIFCPQFSSSNDIYFSANYMI